MVVGGVYSGESRLATSPCDLVDQKNTSNEELTSLETPYAMYIGFQVPEFLPLEHSAQHVVILLRKEQ
jgi:hypothetical protein